MKLRSCKNNNMMIWQKNYYRCGLFGKELQNLGDLQPSNLLVLLQY